MELRSQKHFMCKDCDMPFSMLADEYDALPPEQRPVRCKPCRRLDSMESKLKRILKLLAQLVESIYGKPPVSQ